MDNQGLLGIAGLLLVQTGMLLFWGGRTFQMLRVLQRTADDHEDRLRGLEKGVVVATR